MKKEIIISTYDSLNNPFYSGGGASAIQAVAKRLVASYNITVLTANYQGKKNYSVDGVHYQYIGLPFLGPKVGQLFYQLSLPFYVLTKRFDCWIESFTPPFSTAFLQLFTNKPIIGLVHMLSGEDMRRKYKLPFQLIESIGLKTYHNFIVLSEHSKSQIKIKNPKANILVVTNGIDLPTNLLPYPKRDKKNILFIGRIEVNQKGLDKLILAFKQVIQKHNLTLKIAGSGTRNEINLLKKLIINADLESNVELLGKVEGQAKDRVLSEASVIVIPSRFETFSITALESISYGIPLVCFDIDGMSWIPKELKLNATSFSENSLAEKIIKLLDSPQQRLRISNSQLLEAPKYSWNNISALYEDFIHQVINKNE